MLVTALAALAPTVGRRVLRVLRDRLSERGYDGRMRPLCLVVTLAVLGCSSDPEPAQTSRPGTAGQAGSGPAGQSGASGSSSAGTGGAAGQSGGGQAGAGQAGTTAGVGGLAGQAGASAGQSGVGGASGQAGAGQGGAAGEAGMGGGGTGGVAGQAGQAGADAGQGGSAGAGGSPEPCVAPKYPLDDCNCESERGPGNRGSLVCKAATGAPTCECGFARDPADSEDADGVTACKDLPAALDSVKETCAGDATYPACWATKPGETPDKWFGRYCENIPRAKATPDGGPVSVFCCWPIKGS